MSEDFAPRPTGKPVEEVTLTGMLLPWKAGDPVLLRMPACDDEFLPLFTREEDLREVLRQAGASFDSIKQVDDGREFLDSLPLMTGSSRLLRVITNPRIVEQGRVRFVEVFRHGPPQ